MKPTLIPVLASMVLLGLAAWAPPASAPSAQQQGGLKRMDPVPEDPQKLDDVFARDFDGARWKERLSDADLERREASYEGLLRRARLDPVARAFLEELARDPSGGETAWTARLALRELGRARFSLQGPGGTMPFGRSPLALEPFGGDPFLRMQEMMNQLLEQDVSGLLPHAKQRIPSQPGEHSSSRRVRVEQGPDGARILITETIDGEEKLRTYEGPSIEEILRKNPALEEGVDGLSGLRLQVSPGSNLDLQFDLGGASGGARALRGRDLGLPLLPQGFSRPVVTDRLGVIVQPVPTERARQLGLENRGLLVERTVPETLASLLGVKAGDVLLELQGVPLRSGEDIDHVMRGRNAEDPLTLVWLDELGQRKSKTWPLEPGKDKR